MLVLGLCALGGLAPATAAAQSSPADRVAQAVEDVVGATEVRYGATDDRGATLDGLKAIQVGARYVGVYHSPGGASFDAHVAVSDDLMSWTRQATLDTDASQPAIAAVPGGGFLVAYEKAFTADVLPLTKAPAELDVVNGLAGRIRIRLRYYPTLTRLLSGAHAREFTAPRTIALTAEGTPDFQAIAWNGGIADSRIELGLHHFADTNGDLFPDADRQGTAVLTGFLTWRDAKAPEIDRQFLEAPHFHTEFSGPPAANIGDRDTIRLDGARLAVHEAQYATGDFSTWRLFLRDAAGGPLRPLRPVTHHGSSAFGNPTVTALESPTTHSPALFVSMIVFSEGAKGGEAGSLLFYHES